MTLRHTWRALALASLALMLALPAQAQQRQQDRRDAVTVPAQLGTLPSATRIFAPRSTNRMPVLTEDFDAGIPATWTTTSTDMNEWAATTNAAWDGGATYAGWDDDDAGNGSLDVITLETPSFSTVGAPSMNVTFDYSFRRINTAETLTVEYSTDGGTTWALAADLPTTGSGGAERYPTTLGQVVSLPAAALDQADVRVRWVYDDADDWSWYGSVDNVVIEAGSADPVFTLTSDNVGGDGNYSFVGACTVQPSSAITFTVTNTGAGMLSVTGASVSGTDAAVFTVDDSNLPATLAAGESVTIPTTVVPVASSEGLLSASLDVNYNDGAAQTGSFELSAQATDSNPSFASENGYAFGNSTACNTGSVMPSGTGVIDFSGHTEVTTWTTGSGDDGAFAIDAAALDALGLGSFKLFGDQFEQLFISSNGGISFGSAVTSFQSFDTTVPVTTGGGAITAYADLDMRPGNTTAAVPAPGVFYGMDGDNLVVTYAYARLYTDGTSEDNTPWATYQFVLEPASDGDAFNGLEDHVEIRFIGSAETNGSGQPYTVASSVRDFAFNQAVGLFNPEGTASVSYLSNAFNGEAAATEDDLGGTFFNLDGSSVSVRFEAETQAMATGGAGWRMLSAPISDLTVGRLADLNLVQGVAGQYPDADGILFDGYDGTAYTSPTDESDVLEPGRAFFWYLFDNDLDPEDPNPDGAGTSNSYALPMALQGTGVETAADPVSVTLNTAGDATTLVGNPFRSSLDVSDMDSWATGGGLFSAIGQIWDGSGYTMTTDPSVNEVVSAWQGMFIENTDATSLDIPASAKTMGGTLVYRSGASRVAFELAGTAIGGTPTLDRALIVELSGSATDGWDLRDASKLRPILASYATAAFLGERDGQARLKAQESRALASEGFDVPVVIDAVGVEDELTISWPTLDIAEDTPVSLRDLVTGEVINLRTQGSYTFTVAPEAAREGSPADLLAGTADGATAKAGDAPRFVLTVGSVTVANEGDAVTEFALESARPNPTRGTASVRFALPEAGDVDVTLYDLLGRRVAVLAQGEHGAGWHTASLDASTLSAGVYVLRMQTDGFAETRRVTVVR